MCEIAKCVHRVKHLKRNNEEKDWCKKISRVCVYDTNNCIILLTEGDK